MKHLAQQLWAEGSTLYPVLAGFRPCKQTRNRTASGQVTPSEGAAPSCICWQAASSGRGGSCDLGGEESEDVSQNKTT